MDGNRCPARTFVRQVPEDDAAVLAAGGEIPAVVRIREAHDRVGAAGQAQAFGAAVGIPENHLALPGIRSASGDPCLAVGGNGERADAAGVRGKAV